jgi:LysM repeat protein
MALVMVALILFPIISSQKGGGVGNGGGGNGGSSPSPSANSSALDSEQPSASAGQAAASLPDGWFSYRVLPGDFVAKIAQKFNLQVWEVEVANPQIHNFDILYVGWNLKIPPPGLLTPPPATAS